MDRLYERSIESESKQPHNIVAVRIDPISGLLAKPDQENGVIEYFRDKEVPKEEDPTPLYNANTNQQQQEEEQPFIEDNLF